MQNSPSFKSTASTYGLTLGIILVLFFILIYTFNLELITKWWLKLVEFLLIIVIALVGMSKCKKAFNGTFTYKYSFTSYFIIIVIGLSIYTLSSYLLFNFIDPDAAQYVLDETIRMTRNMMEGFGAPDSEIDKAIAKMESENQFSLSNQIMGLAITLIFYSVIGLLLALIFREKDTTAA